MRYRLGLDVGTNSLGWSVLTLDDKNEPCAIEAAGSRIFSDGRDDKSLATLATDRRMARSARRRRDRFKQRQRYLLCELEKIGLLPPEGPECKNLQILNPLELRARALTDKLEPFHIGRALFHLNQRRGFKSNRKDRSEETTSGKVSSSVRMLLEAMQLIGPEMPREEYQALSREDKRRAREAETLARTGALGRLAEQRNFTYGSFLYNRHRNKQQIRARPGAGENGKLYDVYPIRELYEDEFDKIWDAQAKHYPELMTNERKTRIHHVIFTQRPLKPQRLGKCTYMLEEDRAFRAMPSFQRYRIYQEVNNLEWRTSDDNHRLIDHRDARNAIARILESPSRKREPFAKMKRVLRCMSLAEDNFEFNLEGPKRKGLDGNPTSNVMQHEDYVGQQWHDWSLDSQDDFIALILDDKLSDVEVKNSLKDKYGLSEAAAEKCVNANALLVDGTAHISLQAARLMLKKMRDGIVDTQTGEWRLPIQADAAEAVANEVEKFKSPFRRKGDSGKYELRDKLPYYGEVFADGRHIIPGDRLPQDRHDERKYWGGVTNPTVHIALNQIRRVVNGLIDRYGHPYSIAIEVGRDLPAGADKRREIEKEQKKNQDENERLDETLRQHDQQTTRDNRLRLRLWEELDKDAPSGRRCPFSGQLIGLADLFNGSAEIGHLIPFSISLDDSRANKVLCTRQANRDMGQRTPFQAFGASPPDYNWHEIFERSLRLPKPKQWRFQEDALKIWRRDYDDFTSRHLNDTRYIGRLAREYLECICSIDKIDVLTGRLTALLRGHWGLNKVLQEGSLGGAKNRDDHRHHAVDAIVIGMTNRSMLQRVATVANQAAKLEISRLFPPRKDGRSAIEPWEAFRDEARSAVHNIIVSHKAKRKDLLPGTTDGQLHNETAYGIVSGPDLKERYEVVTRWEIDRFKKREHIETICSPDLRSQFLDAFERRGDDGVRDLARQMGIRHLRRKETLSVIPIKGKSGNIYKAYKGDSNWGMEIYTFPEGHEKANKWKGVVISRFDANRPNFKPGQTKRPHPSARLVMRLQINDCIEIEENGQKRIMRVQLMSRPDRLVLAPPNEANVDARARDKDDNFSYVRKTVGSLKQLNPRKVHISPTGWWNYEKRRRPRRNK